MGQQIRKIIQRRKEVNQVVHRKCLRELEHSFRDSGPRSPVWRSSSGMVRHGRSSASQCICTKAGIKAGDVRWRCSMLGQLFPGRVYNEEPVRVLTGNAIICFGGKKTLFLHKYFVFSYLLCTISPTFLYPPNPGWSLSMLTILNYFNSLSFLVCHGSQVPICWPSSGLILFICPDPWIKHFILLVLVNL